MSLPGDSEGSDAATVCAYLGLVDDNDLHATYATDAHRCYRLPNPTRIATQHQEQFCLTADHPSCPIYQGEGVEATTHAAAAAAGDGEAAPAEASQEGEFEPAGPARGTPFATSASRWTSRGLRRPVLEGELSMRAATVSLFLLAAVVVVIAFLVNSQIGDDGDVAPVAPVATETPQPTETPATPERTPERTPEPTPEPTPTATPEPTPVTTEPPATQAPSNGIYVVVAGDTCSAIAVAQAVTLQALLDANGMTEEECLTLGIGRELTIP